MGGMNQWYALAIIGRLVLMGYGAWQDANMVVKYTDVDYYVFSDAAEFVYQVNNLKNKKITINLFVFLLIQHLLSLNKVVLLFCLQCFA